MRDYRERLYAPIAWWLLSVPIVLTLGGTLYAGLPWPWPIVIFAGLAAICAALLIGLSQATVGVDEQGLRAGGVVLPLTAAGEVITLDERQTALLRGPRADPSAHFYSRPYLKESVYVAVDPDVPEGRGVPYWLVGSRHPAEFAAAIERCRVRSGPEPVA
jgi:hypothetical protein